MAQSFRIAFTRQIVGLTSPVAFKKVFRVLICTLAATAGLASTASAGISVSKTSPPTRSQIARAVHDATRSRLLWATVNVCRRRRHGGVMGVRGEMEALGFDATLTMTVQLRQYAASSHRFVWVGGSTARRTVTVGSVRTGVRQDGAEFRYVSDTGRLDALVTFTWTRAGHRLAQVTDTTRGGHPSAAYAQPLRYSAASCRL